VVELASDGSFVAANVPPSSPLADVDGHIFSKLLGGSGRWRIDAVGGIDNGLAHEKTHWGVYLDSPTANIRPAGLTGTKFPYGLVFNLGDPDSGKAMILERQN